MRFIYSLDDLVSKDLENSGFKKIGETIIDGKKAIIFENNRSSYINKYQKNTILLTNKLFF
jgi:hypothetical protein